MILTVFIVSIALMACRENLTCPEPPRCPSVEDCEICNNREDDIIFHMVTFRLGIEDSADFFSVSVAHGLTVTMPFTPAAPSGYSFYGWFLGDNRFVFTTAITQNTTLIARWQPIEDVFENYTVSFIIGNKTQEVAVREFSTVTEPTTPQKEGFSFIGWFLDQTGVVEFSFNTIIIQDISVFAVWQADTFTITYDSNLTVIKNGEEVTYLSVVFGDIFTLGIPNTPDSLYYGLEFYGWFIGDTRLTDNSGVGLYNWNIPSDVEVIAVFNEDYRHDWLVFTRLADGSGYSVIANVSGGVSGGSIVLNIGISIPRTVNGLPVVAIGDNAFSGWASLGVITLPSTLLTSIELPSSMTTIGAFAFGSSGLTSIEIPSGVTQIQANTFNNARNLTSATLPSGLTAIQNSAFQDTVSLTQITLPNSLTTLATMAFQRSGIESIVIPASVLRIEANTFNGAANLQFVQLLRWQPALDAPNNRITTLANINAFTGTNARIYIPIGSYNGYRVDAIATGAGSSVWNNTIFNGRLIVGIPS